MARGSGMKRQRGWEYFQFMDQWAVEYCLQGLAVWDDNVVTLPRTLDPVQVTAQLEAYAKEDHEDFWGAKAAAVKVAEAAARVSEVEASNWGKEWDADEEEDEHGGERDGGDGEDETAMARRRLIEGGRPPPAAGPESGDDDDDNNHELRRLHAAWLWLPQSFFVTKRGRKNVLPPYAPCCSVGARVGRYLLQSHDSGIHLILQLPHIFNVQHAQHGGCQIHPCVPGTESERQAL
jgi:hypothetical protein